VFVFAGAMSLVITMTMVAFVGSESGFCTETFSNNQSKDVGILTVWHDENALYVAYNTMKARELDIPYGWEIAETRLAIGGILQPNPDDLVPGQFPFHEKHDPPIRNCTFIFEFNDWDVEPDEFYVAAQALLVPPDGMETEWSDDFVPCNPSVKWATYFNYTIRPAEDEDALKRTKVISESKIHTMLATAKQH
jgi:hypothetical protein